MLAATLSRVWLIRRAPSQKVYGWYISVLCLRLRKVRFRRYFGSVAVASTLFRLIRRCLFRAFVVVDGRVHRVRVVCQCVYGVVVD